MHSARLCDTLLYHLRTGEQLRGDIAKLTEEKRVAFAEVDMLVKVSFGFHSDAIPTAALKHCCALSICLRCGAMRGEAMHTRVK